METLHLEEFLENGIIKENNFRKHIATYNWNKLKNKKVLIKGCSTVPVPTWAYLIIATELTKHTSKIYFGEKCAAIKIF
tara:strand:- start:191 stop:427 length:237 start_codon:yes stop_codon:yes gene_type:complete